MNSPQTVVKMFEENIAEYTGAPYAVSCDNCTNALKMCCEYYGVDEVTIPKRTYLSVPQSIIQAGGKVKFEDLINILNGKIYSNCWLGFIFLIF